MNPGMAQYGLKVLLCSAAMMVLALPTRALFDAGWPHVVALIPLALVFVATVYYFYKMVKAKEW